MLQFPEKGREQFKQVFQGVEPVMLGQVNEHTNDRQAPSHQQDNTYVETVDLPFLVIIYTLG